MKHDSESSIERLLSVGVRHPKTTLIVTAVVIVFGILSALRISPSPTIESMLAEDNPASTALSHVVNDFSVSEELLLIATIPEDARLSSASRTELMERFAERFTQSIAKSSELRSLCGSVSIRKSPDVEGFVEEQIIPNALLYVDATAIRSVLARLSPAAMRKQMERNEELIATPGVGGNAIAKVILKDPLRLYELLADAIKEKLGVGVNGPGEGLLLSKDGRSLLVRIQGVKPARDLEYAKEFTKAIRAKALEIQPTGLSFQLSGAYAIASFAERQIRRDMIQSITVSIILLSLLFLVVHRRVFSFVYAILPVAMGIVLAFGVDSYLSTSLTPVVAVIGAILAGLAIDYSIHFLSHFSGEQQIGLSAEESSSRTLRAIGPAMGAACITSIIGFVAIGRSSVPAFRQFAVIGCLGLAFSLLATFFVLPALLHFVRLRTTPPSRPRISNTKLGALLRLIDRYRKRLAVSMILVVTGLAGVFVLPNQAIRFESDLAVMHPQPNPPLQARYELGEKFDFGEDSLIVHLQASTDEELVRRSHQVGWKLRNPDVISQGVNATIGLSGLLPNPDEVSAKLALIEDVDVEKVITNFDAAVENSVFNASAFKDYSTFLVRLLSPNPKLGVSVLRKYPTLAKQLLPKGVNGETLDNYQTLIPISLDSALADRAKRKETISTLREALSDIPGATLTGIGVVGHDTESIVRNELSKLLSLAGVAVGIWLLIYYRNVSDLVITLLPAIFGLVCLLFVAKLFDLQLNLVNMIGLPLLVGIGVDDGIFLVSLSRKLRSKASRSISLIDVLQPGCHAIIMTTLSTLLTFGTLAFTSTPAIRSLGIFLGIGITACLFGTLFLLVPILLIRARRKTAMGGLLPRGSDT